MAKKKTLLRAKPAPGQAISGTQRKFNGLVETLEGERERLEAWQGVIDDYERFFGETYLPLLDAHWALNRQLAEALDRASTCVELSAAHRQLVDEIILDSVLPLIESGEKDDSLRGLVERHSALDFDTLVQQAQALQDALAGETEDSADAVEAGEGGESRGLSSAEPPPAAERPRLLRGRHDEEARRQASRSVREVYRQLASSLHPDREADSAERERKTVLMQQVNQAYERSNLLTLLQLQLEIEQIRPSNLADLADDKLKHFNRVLTDQLEEVRDEVANEEQLFRDCFDLDPQQAVNPKIVRRLSRQQSAFLEEDNAYLSEDIKQLQQPENLVAWLDEQLKREQEAKEMGLA
ncbi:J domain-containing protein [Pseudomonas kuykendallii]|uniref:Molecular chaperone DnaJ n=1 Tax=Pseudomonas kuykendallii TaxID=1007099 RepID=A0A2W5CUV5_9PSED|nr:J domain-containing protein [Pseudomonas kuykendallii]PZP23405.1 MAG: hypothetical protein DI599_12185 [Pseudomonas kuykendallii]